MLSRLKGVAGVFFFYVFSNTFEVFCTSPPPQRVSDTGSLINLMLLLSVNVCKLTAWPLVDMIDYLAMH